MIYSKIRHAPGFKALFVAAIAATTLTFTTACNDMMAPGQEQEDGGNQQQPQQPEQPEQPEQDGN